MLLNGDWSLSGLDESGAAFTVSATVPGCVHTDLLAAGMIPDCFYRDNAERVGWVESHDFVYRKTFVLEAVKPNTYLEFDGLDTYADVFVNGQKVGHSENMFLPYECLCDGALKVGENVVEIKFYSPVNAVSGKPERHAAFTWERLYTRRMQCTYGWDWVARFVTMGIYRDVRLEEHKKNTVVYPYIYTEAVTPYGAIVNVDITLRDFADNGDTLKMTLLSPSGEVLYTKTRAVLEPKIWESLSVASPALWYPAGYGEQPIYTLLLETSAGEVACEFGIRELVILRLPDAKGSENEKTAKWVQTAEHMLDRDKNEVTSGFEIICNGVRIYARGADWVPASPFPSDESVEKLERLVALARAGHMNMLRIWGGGILEHPAFYRACDRLGILVSQDFFMACGDYPDDDPAFVAEMAKEARAVALALRNHPCLCYYAGDNENAVRADEDSNGYTGYRATVEGLMPVMKEVDPHHLFVPSSPFGGKVFSCATVGTTHDTNFLGKIFKPLANGDADAVFDVLSRFVSRLQVEEPTLGMPYVSSLRKFLTDEDIFGEDTSLSEYHTKNNPALGAVTIYGYLEGMAKNLFGDFTDGADRVRKLQWLQCEWVRLTLENHRRHNGFNSGILYWMYNDCWPAANSWSFVDYYAMPKPSFYAFSRAAKPVIVSIDKGERGYRVFVCNGKTEAVSGILTVSTFDVQTKQKKKRKTISFVAPADESTVVATLPYGEYDLGDRLVLIADWDTDFDTDRAFFLPKSYKTMGIVPKDAAFTEEEDGIRIYADDFIPYVLTDTPYVLTDNAFMLLPGEEVKVFILDDYI